VLPYDRWSGVSVTNIPIGQGIAVTPIQLAALYGMLASDGVWRRPHLVGRVGGGPRAAVATRRMLPRRVARQVNRMLEGVVADDGTGKLAAVPGYTVAGKTGTTQKLDPDGTYSVRRHIAFFVGFAPARDPRVVTLVLVDEPKGGDDYGGTVAAPVFAELMARALRELRVPRG
jgi:cell division protein FtsI/penicillin-binding protein 2